LILISILTAAVVLLTFYGWMGTPLLLALSLSVAALILVLGRHHEHRHDDLTMLDSLAVRSRLSSMNPALKAAFFVLILIVSVAVDSVPLNAAVIVLMALITVAGGKIPLHAYLELLLIPAAFLLVGGLALLLDYSPVPSGVLQLPFFAGYLVVTRACQISSLVILCKALAAVSCLYALSLSTPLHELIAVLRKLKLPELVIELMFLIYRYIFILSRILSDMKTAADARFGFSCRSAVMRTAGGTMTNLLILSFRKASTSYDAMESRCYDGHLVFFTSPKAVKELHLLMAFCCILALSAVYCVGRWFL